ncbi:MAG: hypothetical protein U0L12_07380 [Ruminococcus sp.]|nr:hypothetical protein [Ruminococcus sp.]
MKRFFYADIIGVMKQAINSGARQMQLSISEEFKDFMAQFYWRSFMRKHWQA